MPLSCVLRSQNIGRDQHLGSVIKFSFFFICYYTEFRFKTFITGWDKFTPCFESANTCPISVYNFDTPSSSDKRSPYGEVGDNHPIDFIWMKILNSHLFESNVTANALSEHFFSNLTIRASISVSHNINSISRLIFLLARRRTYESSDHPVPFFEKVKPGAIFPQQSSLPQYKTYQNHMWGQLGAYLDTGFDAKGLLPPYFHNQGSPLFRSDSHVWKGYCQ